MDKLIFKDSMSKCHKIVTDSNGKRYIMDTSTIRPNVYGLGIIPKQVSVDMVEFGYHDQNFEFKAKPSPKYIGAVAATQPLTTITFKMFENIFLKYNSSASSFKMGNRSFNSIYFILTRKSLHQTSSKESCGKIA